MITFESICQFYVIIRYHFEIDAKKNIEHQGILRKTNLKMFCWKGYVSDLRGKYSDFLGLMPYVCVILQQYFSASSGLSFPGQGRIFVFHLDHSWQKANILKSPSDEDFIALVGKCFLVCNCYQVVNGLCVYQLEYLSGDRWLTW